MESHLVCDERVGALMRRRLRTLQLLSQDASRIFLEGLGFSRFMFEAEIRVDVDAISPAGEVYRLEVKLISLLNEAKGRVALAIRETRRRMGRKGLTHLLFLTPLRLLETDDKHFIKVKGYCLLGIFVSKSELEKKKEEDLVKEVGEEVEKHLDDGIELISISKAEFLENLRLEEQRIELEQQTQKMLESFGTKTIELEQKLEGLSEESENQRKMIEDQGKMIEQIDKKITKTQQQLDTLIKLLSEKLE
ncbi:MAG: hypothetical protein D6732_14070 [Methanobacteriota archaeon]|nr:MAG: hypothetical protein D6732_14070 [Euryarchaeota archaeon]